MAESALTIPQPQSVHVAERPAPPERPVNVGDLERWLSLIGGSALAMYGLRRSLGHFALLFGAGALIYRGLTGHCAFYRTMDVSTASHDTHAANPRDVADAHDNARIVIAQS